MTDVSDRRFSWRRKAEKKTVSGTQADGAVGERGIVER